MDYSEIEQTALEIIRDAGYEATTEYSYGRCGPNSTFVDVNIGDSSKLSGIVGPLLAEGIVQCGIMPWGHRRHEHTEAPLVQQEEEPDHWVRVWFAEADAEFEVDAEATVERLSLQRSPPYFNCGP